MRIAQIAPPLESVPPTRYGGTERVVATLTDALVRRGHTVTLFAPGDSHTLGRLVPTVPQSLWHHRPAYQDFAPFWALTLGKVLRELRDTEFDVLHSHLDYFAFPFARAQSVPTVTTMHGRLDIPEMLPALHEYEDIPLVSISDAQRAPAPHQNWMATVYHGIALDEFEPNYGNGSSSYLAFLGRVSPEKGLDTAIRVARRSGLPLRIAARPPLPYTGNAEVRRDWDHYENDVQPLLEGPMVEMIGQVGGQEKSEFLRNAAALLFPIRWPEPFGLVMPEALACGTPVLALRQGSVPEVINHGVSGFICDDEDGLVDAVRHLGDLSRERCRQEAEARFSPDAMAAGYEQVYARLMR